MATPADGGVTAINSQWGGGGRHFHPLSTRDILINISRVLVYLDLQSFQ